MNSLQSVCVKFSIFFCIHLLVLINLYYALFWLDFEIEIKPDIAYVNLIHSKF